MEAKTILLFCEVNRMNGELYSFITALSESTDHNNYYIASGRVWEDDVHPPV